MILPIAIDLARVPVVLVGRDAQALKRLRHLEADGVARVRLFSDAPSPALLEHAGDRLVWRLPTVRDLAGSRIVFVADLPPEDGADVAATAYAAGALVNIEDQRGWCDFHSPAIVRRGELVISVSTNGQSPALARRIRAYLESLFPDAWAGRVAELGRLRRRLRAHGLGAEVKQASNAMIARRNWLPAVLPREELSHAHAHHQ